MHSKKMIPTQDPEVVVRVLILNLMLLMRKWSLLQVSVGIQIRKSRVLVQQEKMRSQERSMDQSRRRPRGQGPEIEGGLRDLDPDQGEAGVEAKKIGSGRDTLEDHDRALPRNLSKDPVDQSQEKEVELRRD